jgi:DNA-directed RNA polymerase specialized sigma24 family protein
MHQGPRRERGVLSGAGFERLLALLGPDRERAGDRYEAIRAKLAKFFQWRGWPSPDDLVDETMDRVCWRLGEGEQIRGADPFLYFHGVAKNVLREAWQRDRTQKARQTAGATPARTGDGPPAGLGGAEEARLFERKLACLERCLERLDAADRGLIRRYYWGQEETLVEARRRLAVEMGIPPTTLRIRVHRIRVRLAGCVTASLRRTEG